MSGGKEESAGVLGSAGGDGDVNEYVEGGEHGGLGEKGIRIKEAGREFKNRILI